MQLKPETIGKEITIQLIMDEITRPYPMIAIAIWECTSCKKKHEIPQNLKKLSKPMICNCGNKYHFELSMSECIFTEIQEIQVHEINTIRTATLILRGKHCDDNYHKGSIWTVHCKVGFDIENNSYLLHEVMSIDKRRK